MMKRYRLKREAKQAYAVLLTFIGILIVMGVMTTWLDM